MRLRKSFSDYSHWKGVSEDIVSHCSLPMRAILSMTEELTVVKLTTLTKNKRTKKPLVNSTS